MTSPPLHYQHQPWNESCFPCVAFQFENSAHAGGCEHGRQSSLSKFKLIALSHTMTLSSYDTRYKAESDLNSYISVDRELNEAIQ